MSTVRVTYSVGDHVGGTKGYALAAIENKKTGAGILLRIWGKVGSLTSAKVEVYSQHGFGRGKSAMKGFEANFDERVKKDYRMKAPIQEPNIDGLEYLGRLLGVREAVFTNIRPSDLAEVWPDCQIPHGLSNVFPALYEGKSTQDEMVEAITEATKAKRRAELEAFEAAERARKEAEAVEAREAEEALKSNPLFGMFA